LYVSTTRLLVSALLVSLLLAGCGSSNGHSEASRRLQDSTPPDPARWTFPGSEPVFEALRAEDWTAAWQLLREVEEARPAVLYLLAVTEGYQGEHGALYRSLRRLRDSPSKDLWPEISASVAALEKWALPAVLGTNAFCTRSPKNLASPLCPDEDMARVESWCKEYFPSDLDCRIALGPAKEECEGRAWFFNHLDNPVKPDNLARCTARVLFADFDLGPMPSVFLPEEAQGDAT
jgi:hypothetical protein